MRCIRLRLGRKSSTQYFSCSGGPGGEPIKSVLCHIVRSGASGAQNVGVLFSYSGGSDVDPRKSVIGHFTLNLCFCMRRELWLT
jgi:hypothetical protein